MNVTAISKNCAYYFFNDMNAIIPAALMLKQIGNDVDNRYMTETQIADAKMILAYKRRKFRCNNCGKRNTKKRRMKCCLGCATTVYCSKRCQKWHWKHFHHNECKKTIYQFNTKYFKGALLSAKEIFAIDKLLQ